MIANTVQLLTVVSGNKFFSDTLINIIFQNDDANLQSKNLRKTLCVTQHPEDVQTYYCSCELSHIFYMSPQKFIKIVQLLPWLCACYHILVRAQHCCRSSGSEL